jgi:trimethylguanosine synthase
LDQQSWYSVTPESVADYISSRINVKNTLLDAFCGAGGDSIKLAGSCEKIISNDIDPVKLKCLLNNAKIYDAQNITLSNSDFFKLDVKVDAVYLAPPWGGPDYFKIESFHPADF